MTPKWLIAATLLASLTVTAAAPAAARHHRGHPSHAAGRQGYAEPELFPIRSDQPHMVEVRPGLWISSWDCVTDEGQGRWKPCSSTGRGR